MPSNLDPSEKTQLKELDGWIEQLMDCRQLPETNVKTLCEKVINGYRDRYKNVDFTLSTFVRGWHGFFCSITAKLSDIQSIESFVAINFNLLIALVEANLLSRHLRVFQNIFFSRPKRS